MSMLAEPRRKQKICPDPNGLGWSRDEGKIGHKMLERMGWKKGKGLGARQHGQVDPIAVRKKTTMQGVGFMSKDDDNWIAHQDEFNALLSQLNAANNNTDSDGAEVQSLTSKSANAKGRVHYKKLAQGKDLSLRNSNELECVFGVRKKKNAEEGEEEPKIEMPVNEAFSVSTTDVHQYFARKMADLRRRGYTLAPPPPQSEPSSEGEVEERVAFTQDSVVNSENSSASEETTVIEENSSKKNKKSKKRKNEIADVESIVEGEEDEKPKKKKKKKEKKKEETRENVTVDCETTKKKKNKENKSCDVIAEVEEPVVKKKKKKKDKKKSE